MPKMCPSFWYDSIIPNDRNHTLINKNVLVLSLDQNTPLRWIFIGILLFHTLKIQKLDHNKIQTILNRTLNVSHKELLMGSIIS